MLTQPVKAKVQSLVSRTVVYLKPVNRRKAGVYRENVYITPKSVIVPRNGLSADILPRDHVFVEHREALDFFVTKNGTPLWFVDVGSARNERMPRIFAGRRYYFRGRGSPFYWQSRIVANDGESQEGSYGLHDFRKKSDAVKCYNDALKDLQKEMRRIIEQGEKFAQSVAALKPRRV